MGLGSGENGEFTLYEDDGISRQYLQDRCLKTHLTYHRENGRIMLGIHPQGAGYEGMPESRDYRIQLMLVENPLHLLGDVPCQLEQDEMSATILLKNRGIREHITLELVEDQV